MKYNYKGLMKKAFSYINRAIYKGKGLREVGRGLREILDSYEGITEREKDVIYRELWEVSRAACHEGNRENALGLLGNYDRVLRTARKAQANCNLRQKRAAYRASSSAFYLCSVYSKPASDHKELQGKLYVDCRWRERVDESQVDAVLQKIKDEGLMTTQKVMKAPFWLTTRPYCRHYFIPVATEDALGANLMAKYRRKKWYTEEDYYHLRNAVYSLMQKDTPCMKYRQNIKKGLRLI